jgi:hypothetical protein
VDAKALHGLLSAAAAGLNDDPSSWGDGGAGGAGGAPGAKKPFVPNRIRNKL